jgi:tetratricopeptide (TPR) repeat protein
MQWQRTGMMIALVAVGLSVALTGCSSGGSKLDVEMSKKIAGELRDNKLYAAAIEEYRAILDDGNLDNSQKGNISFLVGKVYFEDLKDYANAAAWYVRAREYDPNGGFVAEATQNIVTSLEKMGHHLDARRELGAATDIEAKPATPGDVAVAKIGDKTIYRSEIEKQIQSLPENTQRQITSKESKREFVRQYVGVELMYRAAVREGFDRDPEIADQKDKVIKSLVVQKYLTEKVFPEMKLDTADVHNFYLANRDTRYTSKPYDSVREQVFMDYQSQKAQVAYADYLEKLAKSEQVEFLDQNL